jgi:hypothetical protein
LEGIKPFNRAWRFSPFDLHKPVVTAGIDE